MGKGCAPRKTKRTNVSDTYDRMQIDKFNKHRKDVLAAQGIKDDTVKQCTCQTCHFRDVCKQAWAVSNVDNRCLADNQYVRDPNAIQGEE